MNEYKFPENLTHAQFVELVDDYFLIYGIEVTVGEGRRIMTMVDGERVAVTEEFLRSLNNTVGGRYWKRSINEFGEVVCERRDIRGVEYDSGYETEEEDH